ncbi:MAG: phosphoribosylamine--glycine ligase [Bryobacteraceae bacterium]
MNILVIGGGGREHALAWKLSNAPSRPRVFATPGNPGIARVATLVDSGDGSPPALLQAAEAARADLTVVGPEAPLVAGVVDAFRAAGRKIVGPTASAARLEGSKIFAKEFFRRAGIPTAEFVAVDTPEAARSALDRFTYPVVVKADGLAAGKGVIVAEHRQAAEQAIASLGDRLVIEEFLTGEEVSFITLTDGRTLLPLAATQDHKAVYDGDRGPNTGGMGAYSDSRILSEAATQRVVDSVIRPAVEATGFTGFLYAGLMMTAQGPKVLEFNVRLGDPETQPLMLRLQSDFAEVLMAAASGDLAGITLDWSSDPSVCVVLASGGYPGPFEKGKPISGIDAAEATGATVFHAGTGLNAGRLETAGGRVLGVTASGPDLGAAIDRAYQAASSIHFDGLHYRRDIGRRGLSRYNRSGAGT